METAGKLQKAICGLAMAAGLGACNPGDLLDWGTRQLVSKPPSDSELFSLDGTEATQIYYQFIDERGRVRFVTSLEAVPAAWRARVGFVELTSPPPLTPQDMQRIQQARTKRIQLRQRTDRREPTIILYAADWCGACRAAKRYMDGKGIGYLERNVDEPRWQEEMYSKAGRGGIPVIDIEGQIMRGFNERRFQALLERMS